MFIHTKPHKQKYLVAQEDYCKARERSYQYHGRIVDIKKWKNKIQPTQIPCFGILESTTKEEEQIKIDVWLHGHNFKARKTDMHVYIPFDTVNSKHLAIQWKLIMVFDLVAVTLVKVCFHWEAKNGMMMSCCVPSSF